MHIFLVCASSRTGVQLGDNATPQKLLYISGHISIYAEETNAPETHANLQIMHNMQIKCKNIKDCNILHCLFLVETVKTETFFLQFCVFY